MIHRPEFFQTTETQENNFINFKYAVPKIASGTAYLKRKGPRKRAFF